MYRSNRHPYIHEFDKENHLKTKSSRQKKSGAKGSNKKEESGHGLLIGSADFDANSKPEMRDEAKKI